MSDQLQEIITEASEWDLEFVDQMTPLMKASSNRDTQQVEALLDAGANPNVCNKWLETPLILALKSIEKGSFSEIVEMLLISGANPHVKSKLGVTAYMCAKSRKDERSMTLLCEMGVKEESYEPVKKKNSETFVVNISHSSKLDHSSYSALSHINQKRAQTPFEQKLSSYKGAYYPNDRQFEQDHLSHIVYLLRSKVQENMRPMYLNSSIKKENAGNLDVFDPEKNIEARRKATYYEEIIERPYFGKINIDDGMKQTYYIGNSRIEDLVVSWTTSAADLFYQKQYGLIQHPKLGEVNVDLIRQFRISNGTLIDVHDHNQTSDPMLTRALENKTGEEMKHILETIQGEQNQIIRLPANQTVIVQGSAGSGKTAIALHRLAYLLQKQDKKRYIIFGPNEIFLNHIKNVLPTITLSDIDQTTFNRWAVQKINKKGNAPDRHETFELLEETEDPYLNEMLRVYTQLKSSMVFKDAIESYVKTHYDCLNVSDFHYDGFELKGDDFVRSLTSNPHLNIINRVSRAIESAVHSYRLQLKSVTEDRFSQDNVNAFRRKLEKHIKANIDLGVKAVYNRFMEHAATYLPIEFNGYEVSSILKEARMQKWLKPNRFTSEDIAPLFHIHTKLHGIDDKKDYTVIDEAQDNSPYEIWLLKQFTEGKGMMLLGDMGQSIHSYKNIDSWSDHTEVLEQAQYIELTQSYRSTEEIVQFCNRIIQPYSEGRFIPSKSTVHQGKAPNIITCGQEEKLKSVHKELARLKGSYNNIAMITRSKEEASALYRSFTSEEDIHLQLDEQIHEEQKQITIMPVHLAKGLEYEAVLIPDASHHQYRQSDLDRKLLYVACSRAFHELSVISAGESQLI